MKRIVVLVVLAVVTAIGCTDRDDEVTTVHIRIQNSTTSFFQEVRLEGKDTIYQNIAAGEFSTYLEYTQALRDGPLTVVADSTDFKYTPEAVTNDTLPFGFYTYELFLDASNELDVNFKID